MNINSKDSSITSFFCMALPELADKKAEFAKELTDLTAAIDQGASVVHTPDGRLIIQNTPDSAWPGSIALNAASDKPSREMLALLHDLFMLRLTIQQLDLATTHKPQLHTIQKLCNKVILGQSEKTDKPSSLQASLLQAINFADSGSTAVWNAVAKQLGFEFALQDTKTLPNHAEVSQLFRAVRASPELLNQALLNAAKKGHFEVVRVLCEDDRVVKETRTKALSVAASSGYKEVVMLLLARNPGANEIYKAICEAARANHVDIVELLLLTITPKNNFGFSLGIDELINITMGRANDIELFKLLIQDKRFSFNKGAVFEDACGRGYANVVELLLQHAPPYDGSSAFEIGFFRACVYGYKDVVKVLLQDKRIDPNRGELLYHAARAGKSEVVSLLLADQRVRCDRGCSEAKAAAENCHIDVVNLLLADTRVVALTTYNAALVAACASHVAGHLDVVKALVAHPLANQMALNLALSNAVKIGCEDTVAFLLQDNRLGRKQLEEYEFAEALGSYRPNSNIIKMLLDDRRFNPARALRMAIQSGVFTQMCKYETLNMVLQHKRTNAQGMLLKCLNTFQNPVIRKFIEAACKTDMKLFGLSLSRIIPDVRCAVESLLAYRSDPVAYLEKMKVFVRKATELTSQPIPTSVIEAVRIIHSAMRVEVYKIALAKAERERNRFIHVDDQARIGAVRSHFTNSIQPHFGALFTSYGNTQEERIDAIEYQMRQLFLAEIMQEAQEKQDENTEAILGFIHSLKDEDNRSLLQGNDAALMQKARDLFCDTASSAQTAWRAYDRWAPVGGLWPNLLTSPLEHADDTAFTVGAVGLGEMPTTKMASDLSREMVAYSFLLAIDKDDGDDEARRTRKTAFIAKVAEIRRAHNAKDEEQDDPSCLPGTFSRAGDMWIAHTKSIIPDAPKLLEEELGSLVIEQFQKASKAEQHELHQALLTTGAYNDELREFLKDLLPEVTSEEHDLYNALVMLSRYNAKDVIDGKAAFTEEQLALRKSFVNGLGSMEQLKVVLNARLAARGSRALSDKEFDVYVTALLADIGGPWIAPKLTAIFRAAVTLENPFAYTPPQKGISQQAAMVMLMKLLASVEIEHKMRFIFDVAQVLASGNTSTAHAKLLQVGVLQESINEATQEIEKARAQAAEKRQKKAALWDELYHKAKNSPLAKNDELLKEIVDEVIDGGQDLEAVLKQRAIELKQ